MIIDEILYDILQDKELSGDMTIIKPFMKLQVKEKTMYRYKDIYAIDFSNVKHYSQIHPIIKSSLDLPDYYGQTLDALWDCLTDMVGRPIHIEMIGLDVIERRFGEFAWELIEIFKEFKHYENDKYADQIIIELVIDDKRIALI